MRRVLTDKHPSGELGFLPALSVPGAVDLSQGREAAQVSRPVDLPGRLVCDKEPPGVLCVFVCFVCRVNRSKIWKSRGRKWQFSWKIIQN